MSRQALVGVFTVVALCALFVMLFVLENVGAQGRYKIGVQGREGNLDVLWYYFLVASSKGDQLLVTFTLPATQSKVFGTQDLQLVGSLRWKTPAPGETTPKP